MGWGNIRISEKTLSPQVTRGVSIQSQTNWLPDTHERSDTPRCRVMSWHASQSLAVGHYSYEGGAGRIVMVSHQVSAPGPNPCEVQSCSLYHLG